jgi:hypothetical protein
MKNRGLIAMLLTLAFVSVSLTPQAIAGSKKRMPARAARVHAAAKSKAAIINLAKQYKETLAGVLKFHETELSKAATREEKDQQLFQLGAIKREDLAASQQALLAQKLRFAKIRKQVEEAEHMIMEAEALDDFINARPGQFSMSAALIRFSGLAGWELDNITAVKKFFTEKFGRALPISAYGQSATHDRLGFNHRHAIDVAINPDSAEGQALLAYLRSAGVPFLAFRRAVPGASTGAHIHIGKPSSRF